MTTRRKLDGEIALKMYESARDAQQVLVGACNPLAVSSALRRAIEAARLATGSTVMTHRPRWAAPARLIYHHLGANLGVENYSQNGWEEDFREHLPALVAETGAVSHHEHPKLTVAQYVALRHQATYSQLREFAPQFDLGEGYVAGWIGREPQKTYVGVSPTGEISS